MGKTNQLGVLADVFTSDASNNVGIGGSPSGSYKFEVTGTGRFTNFLKVSGNNALGASSIGGMEMAYFGAEAKSRIIIGDGTGYSLSFSKRTGSANTDLLTVLDTGNVGIGTSSPSGELHIKASSGFAELYVQGASSTTGMYLFDNNTESGLWKVDSGYMAFATTNVERMRITSAGQIYNSNAPSADWGMRIFGSSVSGSSYGMEILGGTTSGDISFAVSPRNGSVYYFRVLGNGDIKSVPVYNNSTSNSANMYIFSDGSFSRSTSSLRFKTDVETLDNNISETIYKMRPIWYRSLCEKDRRDWSWYGFGAEELAKLEPRLVHWGYKKEDYVINEETKEQELKEGAELQADGVQYERITVLLVAEMQKMNNAIQELSAQNQNLKSRLDKAGL